MGVRMMKWRPWPPLSSKKFEAKILVRCLQGLPEKTTRGVIVDGGEGGDPRDFSRLGVEVKWKGSIKSSNRLNFKRSSVKRNLTTEESLNDEGVVEWNEEFVAVCDLVEFRDGCFQPWEVAFRVFDGLNQGPKRRNHTIATGSLNLAEFASIKQEKIPTNIHLSVPNSLECTPILSVSLSLLEYAIPLPLSHEPSGLKSGFKKVKIFRVLSAKKICHEEEGSDGKSSVKTESSDYPFDSDSLDGTDGPDSELDTSDSDARNSFGYETLAYANNFNSKGNQNENRIYQHYKTNEDNSRDLSENKISKSGIFAWRKRKLGFRSRKGEPLLKKEVREEGGDDIDFDRRMLTSSDIEGSTTTSEFGDDNFTVGKWEKTKLRSRDGKMEIKTQVFFASIDQRSEGESACTVLVAKIANWLQNSHGEIPGKSELDSLIREGSLEWRNLCENKVFRKRFPDQHFDLETVLKSENRKDRNLVVVPEKSFVGFFQNKGVFDFLHGAMSFDDIFDEIGRIELGKTALVYIVSWNDHFFVLKVDRDAYYIIDTLGERLYEGCDRAYVLKFDKDTRIERVPDDKEEVMVSKGKEACKEYIKSFLAAIPLRELQTDVEKGLVDASSPIVHHRLQIEFHYTMCLE